jgi:LysM repeat protein
MTSRHPLIVSALIFSLTLPTFSINAQTNATPDASSTNAAPAPAPAPVPTPSPTAPADTNSTPAAAEAPTERPSTYTVAQGDSLWTIAHKFSTTVVKLRKLNKLKKGALLHPGQVLQIPPATSEATK